MKKIYSFILAITLLFTISGWAQVVNYSILKDSVAAGAVYNITTLTDAPSIEPEQTEMGRIQLENPFPEPMILDAGDTKITEIVYSQDSFTEGIGDNPLFLNKALLTPSNNSAPPDPTIAVGPNHVMVLTNNTTGINIFDKQGNLLKAVNSTTFWNPIWPSQSGDPQIVYDHYHNRWVIVFMQVDATAQIAGDLVAYSDDDDPFGTWYLYRLPHTYWGDYPQIGFDEEAIYIATRSFNFAGGYRDMKIRVISTSELYASNGGKLTYTDLWNITLPGSSTKPDGIHPSFQYSTSGGHYLLWANRSGANFYCVYKLTNPTTNPVLTGTNIFVPVYGETPDAIQLGGTTKIATNGSHIKTSPIFKDGHLYATHSVRNASATNYSNVKYIKIDVSSNTVVENYELTSDRTAYFYPAIALDKDNNVMITCSRSGDSEYPGSYYLGRRATDPPGLSSAYQLQEGLGNYVCTFCGTRNRWGDYLGIYTDPTDEYGFWMVSEYARSTNTYAMAIGHVRLKPFPGISPWITETDLAFGPVQIGAMSDTISVTVSNYGDTPWIISAIPQSVGDFHRLSSHTFPLTINTYDSVVVKFGFSPTSTGLQNVAYSVTNNSGSFSAFQLSGEGYLLAPANVRQLYTVSGSISTGNVLTLNKVTGTGTIVGASGFNDLIGFTINSKDNQIYATRSLPVTSEIYRINALTGGAYLYKAINISELYSISFDSSGQMYGTSRMGGLYTINPNSAAFNQVGTIPFERVSIAFNPINNELWGSVKNFLGNPKDRILRINPLTGDTLFSGRTNFSVNTTDIAFDENGVLYGIKGSGNVVSDLFTINQTTGAGSLVGTIGIKDQIGLGYSVAIPTDVNDEDTDIIPNEFSLEQNYPNPFNPITTIKFNLPLDSKVRLTVFNLLGEIVTEIVNSELSGGTHTYSWKAVDYFGNKVSSGIYFYELRASSVNGEFNQIRKMVLLK